MAVTPRNVVGNTQLGTSNATLHTATNVQEIIDAFTICNTSAAAATATIDLVSSGGTAGVTHRIISARSIGAGETYRCPEAVGHTLNTGDSIQGLASDASALTVKVSARVVTG